MEDIVHRGDGRRNCKEYNASVSQACLVSGLIGPFEGKFIREGLRED
jgi:hypothetical protein